MDTPRHRISELVLLPLLLLTGTVLWLLHAQAWDLGGKSPVLGYDTAQYALAARELAWHGRFATPFALPIELTTQAQPPWPLAVVQPGLVLVEAAIFKLVPARAVMAGSEPRGWLTLILPFCCYLMLGASMALAVRHLMQRWWVDASARMRAGAGLALGLVFLLDPESQHFAMGGFTELPFTLGLLFAVLGLALEAPGFLPLQYGLVLGLTGLFRANMLMLAPVFALAAAWSAPEGRRLRTLLLVLLGWALPLAPWWFYKWRAFGSPGWDLTKFVVWDGVGGRSWFSLYHLPELPELPKGAGAAGLLAAKVARNAGPLANALFIGPRALWLVAIPLWLWRCRPERPLAAAALVVLAATALGFASAAVSIPWTRYVYTARVLAEPVGLLALCALVRREGGRWLGPNGRRAAVGALGALAIAWGVWTTLGGNAEAREASRERGVPTAQTLTSLSILLNDRLEPGEPVMSNLGPALAWQTNHPVVHLALTPADVEACRRRLDTRHVVLAFRNSERAWPGWNEIMERPGAAQAMAALSVLDEKRFRTADGFSIVWLELAPLAPAMASAVTK
ncbi:MAG: hypothetical protein U0704_03005 [Candidatus Eisenbacteria bacterium]